MTTLLDKAIARLKALPEDRREAAAHGVLQYIDALEEDTDTGLTPEESAELARRLVAPREDVPDSEMNAFFAAHAAP
jgi:hypothetical protein